MPTTVDDINSWLTQKENEHFEFKAASNSFDFDKLAEYCCALANEGGGKIVLGITDKLPRKVIGSQAFANLEQTTLGLLTAFSRLCKVEPEEIAHPNGRVIVFTVKARPRGMALPYKGVYWMRAGESLTPMSYDMLRAIHEEHAPDFSALICEAASETDLAPDAIEKFRQIWMKKTGNAHLATLTSRQLLSDAELLVNDKVTNAALILLGTPQALAKHLPQAEVIFEYRAEHSVSHNARVEYRRGYLLFHDELWLEINKRNDIQHYQDNWHDWEILTFDELVIREAIQNAIVHRDYRQHASILIHQFPKQMDVISPGGFLPGITPENILWKHVPRNRLVAEALQKCGLVDRSGQGANRMFEQSIRQGKRLPDYSRTSEHEVNLVLEGQVQDPQFVRFLERTAQEKKLSFTIEDLLVLDCIHRETAIHTDPAIKQHLKLLQENGIVEKVAGRGKSSKYILSRHFYNFIGQKGVYTRKKGLSLDQNKLLLLGHIQENGFAAMSDLEQVLPNLSKKQLTNMLNKLKEDGKIKLVGQKRGSRWEMTQ